MSKSKILRVFLAVFFALYGLSGLVFGKGPGNLLMALTFLSDGRAYGLYDPLFGALVNAAFAALGLTLMWLWLVKRD